jgi:hypothetical protein
MGRRGGRRGPSHKHTLLLFCQQPVSAQIGHHQMILEENTNVEAIHIELANRFIEHLQVVTTNIYNSVAISILYSSLEHSLVFLVCY